MKKRTFYFILLLITIIFGAVSCDKDSPLKEKVAPEANAVGIIPVEQALQTLADFMLKTEPVTKSGVYRKIGKIETHYNDKVMTKAGAKLPAAYVVNFENERGFAVLGANTRVADIVCVVDDGSIDAETLEINCDESDCPDVCYGGELPMWSEDGDFYCYGDGSERERDEFVREMIKSGIGEMGDDSEEDSIDDNSDEIYEENLPERYHDITPIVNLTWDQWYDTNEKSKYPCNVFCYCNKNKKAYEDACKALKWDVMDQYFNSTRSYSGPIAPTGCWMTACAMTIATLRFPQVIYINGERISYEEMTKYGNPKFLSEKGSYHKALLMAALFHNVIKTASPTGTGTTANQIKKILTKLGYVNVLKYTSSKGLTSEMLDKIKDMLLDGKPALIGAHSGNGSGHAFIIDGTQSHLLHVNFGWKGTSNGYYTISCLNPYRPVRYDYYKTDDVSKDHAYELYIRLLTYDIPDKNEYSPMYLNFEPIIETTIH